MAFIVNSHLVSVKHLRLKLCRLPVENIEGEIDNCVWNNVVITILFYYINLYLLHTLIEYSALRFLMFKYLNLHYANV